MYLFVFNIFHNYVYVPAADGVLIITTPASPVPIELVAVTENV